MYVFLFVSICRVARERANATRLLKHPFLTGTIAQPSAGLPAGSAATAGATPTRSAAGGGSAVPQLGKVSPIAPADDGTPTRGGQQRQQQQQQAGSQQQQHRHQQQQGQGQQRQPSPMSRPHLQQQGQQQLQRGFQPLQGQQVLQQQSPLPSRYQQQQQSPLPSRYQPQPQPGIQTPMSARGQPPSQQIAQQQQQQPRQGLTPVRGTSVGQQQGKGGSPNGNLQLDLAGTVAEGRGGAGGHHAEQGGAEGNTSIPPADCNMPSCSTLYKGVGDAAAVIVASRPMQTQKQQQQHEHQAEQKRQAVAGASPSRQQQPVHDHSSSNVIGRPTSGAMGSPGGMRASVRDVPLRLAVGKAQSTAAARQVGHRQGSTVQGYVCPTMNWNPIEEPSWMPDSRATAAVNAGPLSVRRKLTPERERRRATVYGDEGDGEVGPAAAAAAATAPEAGEARTGGEQLQEFSC